MCFWRGSNGVGGVFGMCLCLWGVSWGVCVRRAGVGVGCVYFRCSGVVEVCVGLCVSHSVEMGRNSAF